MTSEPTAAPILPRYGESSLADLASSLLAVLGVEGEANPLNLSPASRVCLLLIDGLGWEQLREHPAAAPFLSELALNGGPLTAGFPATTVASLSSLGTARPPGQHGMLGYQVAVPGQGKLLNGLRWDPEIDPVDWQPGSTVYQRAARAGVSTYRVAASKLEHTGLSTAVMRGTEYRPADSLGELAARAAEALRTSDRALASVYHGQLDGTGHRFGCSSGAWRYELGHVDKLAEQLAAALPEDAALYVTADHGMVDVPPEDRVDVDAIPALREGVALLGGEPRARHVYAEPGAAEDVLAAWREIIGERAWVLSREAAIDAGWFGPVLAEMTERIGDVVAAPVGATAIVATKAEALESSLVGMHGSLTSADQLVPLLHLPPRELVLSTVHGALGRGCHQGLPQKAASYPQMSPRLDTPLIDARTLAAELAAEKPWAILDVRWRLTGPPGIDAYRAGHVPGAVFVDLDKDLAAPPGDGGRHPLPSGEEFGSAMRRAGVGGSRPVVVYDEADSTAAARAWWLLRYFGHPQVAVLDGGYRAWAASGGLIALGDPVAPAAGACRCSARQRRRK